MRKRNNMFPKRETKRMTNLLSSFGANIIHLFIAPEKINISIDFPNYVSALVYILVAVLYHSFWIGCIKWAIDLWDSIFSPISIILFIIPLLVWGACIYFTVLSIIDLIKWIKKKRVKD